MKVGLKYCGGCNPNFDRLSIAKSLLENISEVSFISAFGINDYSTLIVINGCKRACVNLELYGGKNIIHINAEDDLLKAIGKLKKILPK